MATFNVTGGKYAIQTLSAVGTTTVTIGTATFVSGDFGTKQRMVALFDSANAFKGIAWVRQFQSTTVLQLENRFVDPVTGLFATQVVGDKVLVSKNISEIVVAGITWDSVTRSASLTSGMEFGTASTETSCCIYDEGVKFAMTDGIMVTGGVVAFGKLISYDGASRESFVWSRPCSLEPLSTYSGAGAGSYNYSVLRPNGAGGHFFMFGGNVGGSYQSSNFMGIVGAGNGGKSFAFFGTCQNYGCTSPVGGTTWGANAARHLLYNCTFDATYANANLIMWGDGTWIGGNIAFPQYASGTLGAFRANGTSNYSAPSGKRALVSDLGQGALIDGIVSSTYNFTNLITPAVNSVRTGSSGASTINATFSYQDDYTNLKPDTTVVVRRMVDSVVATSVVNTASSTFTAKVLQSSYTSTTTGNMTQTASYSSFDYTVKCYGYAPLSGNYSTVSYSLGTGGTGTNLTLGGLTNQTVDSTTTLTLANALALSSKIAGNSATDTCTISSSSTMDEQYDYLVAWGCSSAALAQYPSLSTYPVGASGTTSQQLMKLVVAAGATYTAGTKLKDMSGSKNVLINGTITLNRGTVTWAPAAYADQWQVGSGGVLNLTGGTLFTVNPTTGLGYGSAATAMFRSGSTLNLSDSTVVYNIVSGGSGTFFSNSEAGSTWNISNSTLTLNCPNGAQVAIHAYFLPASTINNFTVNGTATNTIWQMGYLTNNSKMVGFKYGGAIFGNGTSNVLMDTYTYTGALTTIPNTFGSSNKWWWVDPVMNAGGLFRWNAGATATGNDGFYGVIGFRPTITMDKTGFAPKVRFTPSAMASRYPSFQVQSTALSNLALSSFFRDPTFMSASDGFLPFIDSLDAKNVINTIDWTVETRQAGWLDQTVTFTAATAKKGLVSTTFSGAVDSNYVNATTAAADSALITVNTSTKTIAPVSGTLAWSPQRLYNALKNWWATYASNTNFLAASGSGYLDLGDYNTSAELSFVASGSTDSLQYVRTTGTINALVNAIPVTDTRGTSTIVQVRNVAAGGSVAIYNATGVTKYFQANVAANSTHSLYITAGISETWTYAVELLGKQRQTGTFPANAGGIIYFVPEFVQDIGITNTSQASIEAYTSLETNSKVYDRIAVYRLTEEGIKLGQIITRSGTQLVWDAGLSAKVKKDNASVINKTGNTFFLKATTLSADTKYTTHILTAPATLTADTDEVLDTDIEDGNGNSFVTISGGRGNYEIWKIPSSTASADYATGTKVGNFTSANNKYRFIGDAVAGYDYLSIDTLTTVKDRSSAVKGVYTHGLLSGAQIQSLQQPQIDDLVVSVAALHVDINAIKGTNFNANQHGLDKATDYAQIASQNGQT